MKNFGRIIQDIADETERQDRRWGADRRLDPYVWCAILTEECGEVAEACLHLSDAAHRGVRDDILHALRTELVQVAAVAVQAVADVDRMIESNSITYV